MIIMNCSDPIIADIFNWLSLKKICNGGKYIPHELNQHPQIKNYLKSYCSDLALDIENDIANLKK